MDRIVAQRRMKVEGYCFWRHMDGEIAGLSVYSQVPVSEAKPSHRQQRTGSMPDGK